MRFNVNPAKLTLAMSFLRLFPTHFGRPINTAFPATCTVEALIGMCEHVIIFLQNTGSFQALTDQTPSATQDVIYTP